MIPGIGSRSLTDGDWREIKSFTRDEVAAHCEDGAWQNIDAGSLYQLDAFASYLVGTKRLIESVSFMPTRNKDGIPTATWNTPETRAHSEKSMHYRGRAFDLMFPRNKLATAWLTAVRCPKFGGLGAYPWRPDPGLHVDTRWVGDEEGGRGFRVFWYVNRGGDYIYLNSETEILDFLDFLREAA